MAKEVKTEAKVCVGIEALWEALAKDLRTLIPKIIPNLVKSVEVIEGDGGIGTLLFSFGSVSMMIKNIRIGEGAKIGAGSVVIKEVPARTTVVGNPAKLLGGKNPVKLDKMPSFTMDHTSNIAEWYDYVV